MRHRMTARTDRYDLGRYAPAYATGRELGMNVARQISRLGRTTEARTRSALSDCIVRTVLFAPKKTAWELQ